MICRPTCFKSSHYTEQNISFLNVYDPATPTLGVNLYYHLLEHRLPLNFINVTNWCLSQTKLNLNSLLWVLFHNLQRNLLFKGVLNIFSDNTCGKFKVSTFHANLTSVGNVFRGDKFFNNKFFNFVQDLSWYVLTMSLGNGCWCRKTFHHCIFDSMGTCALLFFNLCQLQFYWVGNGENNSVGIDDNHDSSEVLLLSTLVLIFCWKTHKSIF